MRIPQVTAAADTCTRPTAAAATTAAAAAAASAAGSAASVSANTAAALQIAARELELMQYADYYIDRRDPRRPRFCKRCKAWKPERSHHCSVSGHCILKMVSQV
jgi:hypothetical protein